MADTMPNDDNPDWSGFTPAPLDYAAKLKSARARLVMTQDGFAALLHLPRSILENWEQRRTEPDAFALTIIDLIYDDPEGMAARFDAVSGRIIVNISDGCGVAFLKRLVQ
jgi:transcriptional regulator with XRE-family HTH domain